MHVQPDLWPRISAAAIASKAEMVTALRDRIDGIVTSYEAADKKEAERAWKEWVNEGFNEGASRAHAATRLPAEAIPTAVKTSGGAMSSAPAELLDAQEAQVGWPVEARQRSLPIPVD